jgi:TRAP transporter TAXI family solute receptor
MTRKAFSGALCGLGLLGAALAGCGDGSGGVQFMSLGTAGTGGIYYPIGGALASRLSLRDTLRQYTAEVTGGSVENVNRLENGQMDLAFALPVTIWEAYNGEGAYEHAMTDLRIVAPLYANLTHVMVSPDARVGSISDLRGMRVAVGPPGSGTEQSSRQVLEAHGLTYDDLDARYLSFAEAALALKDRAIDAALISVGYPASSVLDATTTGGIRLLPIDPRISATMIAEYPYYNAGEIPAGAYPGVEEAIPTLAQMNWVVTRESLPADVVDHVLSILSEEREELARVHQMASQIDLGRLADAPIPLHPAAEAWLQAHDEQD